MSVEQVGRKGQDPVGKQVGPAHAQRPTRSQESAPVDRVATGTKFPEQLYAVLDLVLQVGVLDDDGVTGGVVEQRANRRTFSTILAMRNHEELRQLASERSEHGCGAVGRAVVADQDLALE